jgi:hypothetical protein
MTKNGEFGIDQRARTPPRSCHAVPPEFELQKNKKPQKIIRHEKQSFSALKFFLIRIMKFYPKKPQKNIDFHFCDMLISLTTSV